MKRFLIILLFLLSISFYGQTAKGYNNNGDVKHELGDKEGACIDWKKALELGSKDTNEMIIKYCN